MSWLDGKAGRGQAVVFGRNGLDATLKANTALLANSLQQVEGTYQSKGVATLAGE